MEELYDKIRCRLASVGRDNSGVAAVEVILILVVLIGLVIIFKTQAVSLVTKIWNSISDGSNAITG